ncbi:MAG TPA: SDR family NAD(P)-dependent oxidoreductase [Thermomicrobiales bacterium]|nr:SDR family NAD(P)-dependent oxidoreductase [Thermomicrobiales bacterium]
MPLAGKVALVTGAGHGIGRAIVERLAADGVKVIAVDLDPAAVGEVAKTLTAQGSEIEAVTADISSHEDVRRAVARAVERFGGLDILCANAGIADAQPLVEIDERSWRRIIDVNLTGTFFCVQEAAKVMIPQGHGAMVVTASTNAFYVESYLSHYNASKGGVVALVRSAALELGQYGIRVNAVEPSMVRTRASFIAEDPVGGPEYLKRVPLGRFAEPAEIASAVAFLASDEASYITGEVVILDGGLTLGIHLPLPDEPLPGSARADEVSGRQRGKADSEG